jgi:hypothetical protein
MFSATPMRNCRLDSHSTPTAAKPLLTPPPIQRQDSSRLYAEGVTVRRQIPLGEVFAGVTVKRDEMRSRMVKGAHIELNYIFAPRGEVGKITRGTRGCISKRMGSGWLMVRFEGINKCVKVRTSNCRYIPVRPMPCPSCLDDVGVMQTLKHADAEWIKELVGASPNGMPTIEHIACARLLKLERDQNEKLKVELDKIKLQLIASRTLMQLKDKTIAELRDVPDFELCGDWVEA